MNLFRFIRTLFPERKILPGHYDIKVVSLPDEIHLTQLLPSELNYVIEKNNTYKVQITKLLEHAGLGLRTIEKTPEIILDAINEISVRTQHRMIITWLEPLLKKSIKPIFTMEDYDKAQKDNVDLDKLVETIFSRRYDFKQFVLIDESSHINLNLNIQSDFHFEDYSIEYIVKSLDIQSCPKSIIGIIKDLSTLQTNGVEIKWISDILYKEIIPTFTEIEKGIAKNNEIDLKILIRDIESSKEDFKFFLKTDRRSLSNYGNDIRLVEKLNHEIEEISLEYALRRMTFDNADTRTAVAQSIIKALLFIGPITHVLEKYVHGIGKVFAASTDDILSETAELFALRGSGFSWKLLFSRLKILLPIFVLATFGAFSVEHFIDLKEYTLGGIIFGFSAVALSLTTAILSIRLYMHCVDDLTREKKFHLTQDSRWIIALKQDFTNPARLGLFIGAFASPIFAGLIFNFFSELVHNGWVLSLLGSTETVIAGFTVIVAKHITNFKYKKFISYKIKSVIKARKKK